MRLLASGALLLTLLRSAPAPAASITVLDPANSGADTLRQAVIDTNAMTGMDTIAFELADNTTITLASGLPAVTGDLLVDGSTAPTLSISGAGLTVLSVETGTTTLRDLNVTSGDLSVAAGATLAFEQTMGGSFSGVISGAGALQKLGPDELTLSGANTYTGGTTISAGTVRGAAGAVQGDVAVAAAALLVFDQAADGSHAGVISGAGSVTKIGAGTLTLSGANTYSGGTTVAAGVLRGNTSSLQGDISNDATLAFDQAGSGTYTGIISGTGALLKQGGGMLTLTGNHTFMGLTSVSAGRLVVDGGLVGGADVAAGAVLGGSGNIAGGLRVSGTVAPGSSIGVLNADSVTFDTGSSFEAEVDDLGNGDRLAVQSAIINGGTVTVVPEPSDYATMQSYTILSSANPITGSFDGLAPSFAFLDATLGATANSVFVTLVNNGNTFTGIAATENQQAVARVLEAASPTATGDLVTVLDTFTVATEDDVRAGLDEISGNVLGSFATLRLNLQSRFSATLDQRIRDFGRRKGGAGLVALPVAARSWSPEPGKRGFGGWLEGYATSGELDGDTNARGFDYTTAGGSFGLDFRLSESELFGLSGGYARSEVDFGRGAGDGDVDTFQAAIFGAYTAYRFYLGFSFGYALHEIETSRRIAFSAISRRASADFDGDELSARLEFGTRSFGLGRLRIQPSFALDYTSIDQDGFTETGAGALNLSVEDQSIDSLIGTFGARFYRTFDMGADFSITPELRAYWVREFRDIDREIDARLTGAIAGGVFTASGIESSRNTALLGLGYTVNTSETLILYLQYDVTLNKDLVDHSLRLGLSARW